MLALLIWRIKVATPEGFPKVKRMPLAGQSA